MTLDYLDYSDSGEGYAKTDDSGNWAPDQIHVAQPAQPATSSLDDYYRQIQDRANTLGITTDLDSYKDDLGRIYQGSGGVGARTMGDNFAGIMAQLDRRAASNQPRESPESSPTRSAPSGGSWNFSDPIGRGVEEAAARRASQLENPPEGSGQNLLEAALKNIAAQFGQGGYTNAQQEILNTQALEPIDQLRFARRQQVLANLSQRGIDPNSGVGRSMLQDVDRQFDQAKIQQRRSLANQAVNEQQARLLQSIQLLSQLAGGENARLDKAYDYRTVPLNLADRAFNQANTLYQGAGNPLALISPLLQLQAQQQGQQGDLSETLGYLAYQLMNQNG